MKKFWRDFGSQRWKKVGCACEKCWGNFKEILRKHFWKNIWKIMEIRENFRVTLIISRNYEGILKKIFQEICGEIAGKLSSFFFLIWSDFVRDEVKMVIWI